MSAASFPALVFADGASSGNPGPGGWGAIIVTPSGQVQELGGGEPETTNNRMELMGAIRALETLARLRETDASIEAIDVHTDSTYVIRGITQWCWGWRKRGWKTAEGAEVSNQDLWKRLIGAVASLKGAKLEWKYVRGHAGIPGNERVDEIAVGFSKGSYPRLYRGPLLGYGVAIHDLPENFELPEMRPREAKAAAHSYLSLVGGIAVRHPNWAACERRVKGRSGAKFKKAMSAAEESAILAQWGISPERVQNE